MKNVRKKRRRRRRRSALGQYGRSMFAVSIVILLLVAVVTASGMSLRAKEKSYQAQAAELNEQIEQEKERASQIDELAEYVGTDEYVEEVAKDKLGLVNPNEIIFKAK